MPFADGTFALPRVSPESCLHQILFVSREDITLDETLEIFGIDEISGLFKIKFNDEGEDRGQEIHNVHKPSQLDKDHFTHFKLRFSTSASSQYHITALPESRGLLARLVDEYV
jgi:hypothetical protein